MDDLIYQLNRGPSSVADLARVLGKSSSTIYKQLQKVEGVQSKTGPVGKVFWLEGDAQESVSEPLQDESELQVGDPTADVDGPTENRLEPVPAVKGKRGRKPTASGQHLMASVDANPRRKGSHGFKSLQIVIDNPGISTEEFVAKGGRLNDLRWDLKAGNIRAATLAG